MSESLTKFPDLPPYTYVPGHAPHPVSHPDGHLRGFELPDAWSQADHFEWGRRLFNNGFYWEAHEAWEHLWLELGRTSDEALIVKGLIKLAASGVKCRECNATGAVRHATRSAALLQPGSTSTLFANCDLVAVKKTAETCAATPPVTFAPASSQPVTLPGMQV